MLQSIGETFSGAKQIQLWLTLCARLISKSIPPTRLVTTSSQKSGGISTATLLPIPKAKLKKEQMTSVVWTTPLGLPIVQPYRKTQRKQRRHMAERQTLPRKHHHTALPRSAVTLHQRKCSPSTKLIASKMQMLMSCCFVSWGEWKQILISLSN